MDERTFSRDRPAAPVRAPAPEAESRPAGGPPRLTLAGRDGARPSWREREAAKATTGGPSAEPAAAPASEEPTRRTGGYVPPARREAGAAGGWREREGSGRGPAPSSRDESPATAPGRRYQLPGARRDMGERSFSGRGREQRENGERGESPAAVPSRGGYVPPHLRGDRRDRPSERDASPAGSDSAPPPRAAASGEAGGKYRPGMFRSRREQQ
jgi:translation initiation factor 3 subunit A